MLVLAANRNRAVHGPVWMLLQVSSAPCSSMSETTIEKPCFANSIVLALPMPDAPPVTNATFPEALDMRAGKTRNSPEHGRR